MKRLLNKNLEKIDIFYYSLAFLRIVLTIIPQWGYIHPDEFFQSVEVIAEDVFDVEANRPWEFNSTFPIRSIFAPSITVGLPYKMMKMIDRNLQFYFDYSIKTPYWLLVFPRLFLCLLSFIVDYSIYKICYVNCENYKGKLIVLASSYVVLVYGTHTFSNSIEMILVSLLLYLVADSQKYSYAIIRQDEFLSSKYKKADSAVDRARLFKMMALLPAHSMRNCVLISFITIVGIFNRPTFVAFAFPCVFFWVHRGIGSKNVRFSEFHYRMLVFLLCSIGFTCLLIIIDSFYFGYLSVAEIHEMDVSINNFVVTPLNFIKYNMDVNKLAQHGLHPRFLHALVNIPLLYNVLGVVALGNVAVLNYRLVSGQFGKLPRIHSIQGLMTTVSIFSVVLLSYFPHQEPRFLIPITLPLIYLYGDIVLNKFSLMRMWWLLNGLSVLFYGFIHQAGIYPLASHMSTQLQRGESIHLVTSYVYNIPLSLLMQHNSRKLYGDGSSKYIVPKLIILHEMGSEFPSTIVRRFGVIQHVKSLKSASSKRSYSMYLVIPISKEEEMMGFIENSARHVQLETVRYFYPHISTEALPNIATGDRFDLSLSSVVGYVGSILRSSGLGLYRVYCNNSTMTINTKIVM